MYCLSLDPIRWASRIRAMSEDVAVRVTPMRELVAEEIRVLLARRRMSASELARQMGATQPYISRRLTGEIAFDVDDLEKIARVLNVTPRDLVATPGSVPTGQYPRLAGVSTSSPVAERPPTRKDAVTRPPTKVPTPRRPALLRASSTG